MTSDLTHSGFFVLRTPLLAYDELERFSEGIEGADGERELLRARLRELVDRPEVRDALFVASPDLEAALDPWREKPDSPQGAKVERALVRYFERMAARATPFGLFAGCSVGRIGDRTRLVLGPRERNERHSRLDQDYLDALLVALEDDAELRKELSFRPNSSLYRAAGQLRLVERRLDGRKRSHHLSAVEESRYLTAALERARDGATPAELADSVAGLGVPHEDAGEYVADLVDSQVVVPDLDIPVTGPEPLDLLAEELSAHRASEPVGRRLTEIRDALAELDAGGVGAEPARYRTIAAGLGELPGEVELRRLFQVDLHKPAPDAVLGREVLDELVRGVDLLRRISPGRPLAELDRFRERFAERFEGREVPLVEALDDDAGVGFPEPDWVGASPLLEDLLPPSEPDERVDWGKRERFLLRRLMAAVERGDRSIRLDSGDIEALSPDDPPPLPAALAVSGVLAATSPEALDNGDFRVYLEGAVGPSGARLLGRFAHGDPELRSRIEDHLRQEEAVSPDAVLAEIVHLPEGRVGNILCRPVLRAYEIPYLGRSGAPRERQIPVTDLMVSVSGHPTVSPVGEGIVLRSRRLGCRVLPRMTTAHNFSWRALPLYRFLCLLQGGGRGGAGWDWGPLASAPFLPRVEAGRLVLSLARWLVGKEELGELQAADVQGRFAAAQELRGARGLPRMIGLADADNVLPVDLDNVLSVEAFATTLRGREEATLVELWPAPEELCARGPEGRYVHELVVPLVQSAPAAADGDGRPGAREPAATAATSARRLPPGSDWLYAKLYAGRAVSDRILPEVVAPLVEDLTSSGATDSWFFIRYADPDEHLRLRFHGDPAALHAEVQPRVEAALTPLLEDGRAGRLSFDTYEREVERYGGLDAIEIAERVFHADSETVLELLSTFEPGDRGADERWRIGLCGTSMLMTDLGLDEPARIELLRRLRDSFGREHRVDADYARKLGERLRKHRRELETLVEPGDDVPEDLAPGVEALRERSERIRPMVAQIHSLEDAGRLSTSRASLAASFVHMYMNRLTRSAPRLHELAVYDFLLRLYESRAARARTGGQGSPLGLRSPDGAPSRRDR